MMPSADPKSRLATIRAGFPVPRWVLDGWSLAVPLGTVYLVAVAAVAVSPTAAIDLRYALVNLVIVVALQSFVGNSGVLSFGHIAFVAVGAWTAGLLTVPLVMKHSLIPSLFPALRDAHASPWVAIALAALVGGILALAGGIVLMRLSGLEAGIATFALLQLTVEILTHWSEIGPVSGQAMAGIPEGIGLQGTLFVALAVIVASWVYQHFASARMLRASREDLAAAPASGINVTLHRTIAFTVSGVLSGVGGAMWAQTNRVIQASQFNLDFTFTIIAMLVVGGMLSLWGAVIGTLAIATLEHILGLFERGVSFGAYVVSIPGGSRPVILGIILILILILRPGGITGGREVSWPIRARPSIRAVRHTHGEKYESVDEPNQHKEQ